MMYRLFAMDVDGTLTDGSIYVGADTEYKRFDIKDGMGLTLFRKAGGKIAVISGRYSPATERRARELHFDYVANGCADKLSALKDFARQAAVRPEEVAYAGDDINDVECVRWAGLGIAVADAVPQLIDAADYVTERRGGNGAIREAADMLLSMNAAEGEQ